MFPMTVLFLGGRLAVDLLNTVIARDLLGRREDVAAWGAAAGGGLRRGVRGGGRGTPPPPGLSWGVGGGVGGRGAGRTPPARAVASRRGHPLKPRPAPHP